MFIDHSLILIEFEIGLRRLELGGGRVHFLENAVEGGRWRALRSGERMKKNQPKKADAASLRKKFNHAVHYSRFTQTRYV